MRRRRTYGQKHKQSVLVVAGFCNAPFIVTERSARRHSLRCEPFASSQTNEGGGTYTGS